MSSSVECWFEREHFDELSKYYNENHEELRSRGYRNFGHWLGVLAYVGFSYRDQTQEKIDLTKVNITCGRCGSNFVSYTFDESTKIVRYRCGDCGNKQEVQR